MSRPKAKILCIDDHWNALIGRKMFLEQSGYEVLEATGGDEVAKFFSPRIGNCCFCWALKDKCSAV